MTGFTCQRACIVSVLALAFSSVVVAAQQSSETLAISSRCLNCHNILKTAHKRDVSIGSAWGASMMANAARDPYWQSSVRREALDHLSASAAIQSECAACHMPLQRATDKAAGRDTAILSSLPLDPRRADADGVSCTVCHQALTQGLGTPDSYNGNLVFALPGQQANTLFGPYPPTAPAINIHKTVAHLTTEQSPGRPLRFLPHALHHGA